MNIIVVEDTKTVRIMLVSLLEGTDHFNVVAAVESVEEAMEYLTSYCVDLVILDLCLPGLSYDLAVKAIKSVRPQLDILVFTAFEEDNTVFSAIKAGATGYMLKTAESRQIIAALDEIKAGGSPMSPTIARKVLREFQRYTVHEYSDGFISPLSIRETEILGLLYRGFTITQIADKLFISLHTVHAHIKKIYVKLQVNSRSQAIYEAVQRKLIHQNDLDHARHTPDAAYACAVIERRPAYQL